MTPDQAARIQQQMLGNPESMKVFVRAFAFLQPTLPCSPNRLSPRQMIQNMMKSMDPKTLAALSKQAGMEMSEDQAAKVRSEVIIKCCSDSPALQMTCQLLTCMATLADGRGNEEHEARAYGEAVQGCCRASMSRTCPSVCTTFVTSLCGLSQRRWRDMPSRPSRKWSRSRTSCLANRCFGYPS